MICFCRSMFLRRPINVRKPSHSHLKIFEQLAEDGFLRNNRSLTVFESIPRRKKFFLSVCSMSNLEVLEMHDCKLIFDDLALLFKSCPRLTKLCLNPFKCNKLGWDQDMKNSLKPGFQRLKFFRLEGYVPEDSWSVIQEIFTWVHCWWSFLDKSFHFKWFNLRTAGSTIVLNCICITQTMRIVQIPLEYL